MISKDYMTRQVYRQLARDLNCEAADFEREGFIFCSSKENEGRRPFNRDNTHFDMLTFGHSVIVSATDDIMPFVKSELVSKKIYEAFNLPFVYGNSLYYLPDLANFYELTVPNNYKFEIYEKSDIADLYKYGGFENALNYDVNHARPDIIAVAALYKNEVVGIAGASMDCKDMWQIGVDVEPDHRCAGIAAFVVNKLARLILQKDIIPYYGLAPCNIASQRTAVRAGFIPAWMCAYRGIFKGILTQSPCG